MTANRLTPQREAEIRERAPKRSAEFTEWLNKHSPLPGGDAAERAETVLEEDVPALLAELAAVRAERDQARRQLSVVEEFVAARAEYVTAIRNCHPDNGHDYDRWQGHAAARRQLAEQLGLPVTWPAENEAVTR